MEINYITQNLDGSYSLVDSLDYTDLCDMLHNKNIEVYKQLFSKYVVIIPDFIVPTYFIINRELYYSVLFNNKDVNLKITKIEGETKFYNLFMFLLNTLKG